MKTNYTLLELMRYMLPRPAMYLGKYDMHLLAVFVQAFLMGRGNQDEDKFWADFKQWACLHRFKKYEQTIGIFAMYLHHTRCELNLTDQEANMLTDATGRFIDHKRAIDCGL